MIPRPLSPLCSTLLAATLLAPGTATARAAFAPQGTLLRPVVIAYSNENGQVPLNEKSTAPCNYAVTNVYPNQVTPDGRNRAVISAVSQHGDLTHQGGSRWILDVRVTGTVGNVTVDALIATPETTGSLQNPTWYYVPSADDGVDRVLLDNSTYHPLAAAWATGVNAGKLKVAFVGTGPVGAQTVTGLFVGNVVWGANGPMGPLQDITLVTPGDFGGCGGVNLWKWGTMNHLVLVVPALDGGSELWIADVSGIPAVAPTLVYTGISGDVRGAALSRDGTTLAYVGPASQGRPILLRTLVSGQTCQLATAGPVQPQTVSGLEWSPDDLDIAFHAYANGDGAPSTWAIAVSGKGKPKKLASPRPNGSGGTYVGPKWRR